MRRYWIIAVCGFLMGSCATLTHRRTLDVQVHSKRDSLQICVNNDTSRWYTTPAWIHVKRSRDALLITARKDSVDKQILIGRELSPGFVWGNMGLFFPFGHFIDLTNPKRFTYPSYISIDFDTNNFTTKRNKALLPPEKHLLSFRMSIPEGNLFYLNKGDGYGNSSGFLGISAGVEYYLSSKYSVNMDVGGLMDFIIPFPAPYDRDQDNYHTTNAVYGDIQVGRDFKRWHYDLGFQYSRTSYSEGRTIDFSDYTYSYEFTKNQNNVGLALSTYYKLSRGFNLGVNYYPSYIGWDQGKVERHYSHLLFFELIFKMEAYRPSRHRK
jgi:hypothetical protein